VKLELTIFDSTELGIVLPALNQLQEYRDKRYSAEPAGMFTIPSVQATVIPTDALEDVPPVTLAQAIEEAKAEAIEEPKAEVKAPSDVEIMQLMTAAQQRGVGIPRITELRGPVRVTQMTPEQRIEFVAKLAKEGR